MKLSNFVCFKAVIPQLEADDRDGVIKELIVSLSNKGKIDSKKCSQIIKAVISRENEATTGIGKGLAVPHVKHAAIKEIVAVIGCKSQGIDFSSLDKQPVYAVILLLSPANDPDKHLRAMENILKNMQKDDFRRFLKQARTVEHIKDAVLDQEQES